MGSSAAKCCSRPKAPPVDDTEKQALIQQNESKEKTNEEQAKETKDEAGETDEKDDGTEGLIGCCCVCCCMTIILVMQAVVWARVPGCGAEAGAELQWNSVIPPKSMTQMQMGWGNMFKGQQVKVYNEAISDTTAIGYWVYVSMFFNCMERYTYVQMVNGTEIAALEAYRPWGLYWGSRFNIFRCAKEDEQYMVEEDLAERPWFSWGKVQVFNIKDSSGNTVATSKHEQNNVFSWGQAFWSASVKASNGTLVASIIQDKPKYGGASSFVASSAAYWENINQKWRMLNHDPTTIPNEVVSLLLTIYDIGRANSDDGDH